MPMCRLEDAALRRTQECPERGKHETGKAATENNINGIPLKRKFVFAALVYRGGCPAQEIHVDGSWVGIMRKRLFLVLFMIMNSAILLLIVKVFGNDAQELSASVIRPSELFTEVDGNRVNVLTVDGEGYLFLPSSADPASITLRSDKEGYTVRFMSGSQNAESLDLGSLIPQEGIYSVQVSLQCDARETETFVLNIMQGSGIGTLFFHSDDEIRMGREWIDSAKENRGSGTAVVMDPDGKVLNSRIENRVVTNIHGHGSSSWECPKKGYQIRFEKKVALVQGAAAAKKWLLLAQYQDPLKINDKIMKDIGVMTSSHYSPRETWVNLYYDGNYRGIYLLSEKNEIKTGRININDMEEYYSSTYDSYGDQIRKGTDNNRYGNEYQFQETIDGPDQFGGYLMELHDEKLNDHNGFMVTCDSKKRAVFLKSPELGSREAVEYISEYFQEFCNAVGNDDHSGRNTDTGLYYYDYCDLDSLVDTYLLQTLASEHDSFFKSAFFYKDRGEIMYAGPVWDMDLSFGMGWKTPIKPDRDYLSKSFITKCLVQIPAFRRKLKERYFEVFGDLLGGLSEEDASTTNPSFPGYYDLIKDNLQMDHILWPERYKCGSGNLQWEKGASFDEILEARVQWIREHKEYLDSYFAGF